ncbi:ABC transporter permease [Paenibacillus sp. CAU 1782]
MYNLIMVEWFKLRKNRSFWTMLAILAILSLAYPLLYYFDSEGPGYTGVEFLLAFLPSNAYAIKIGVAVLAGFFISNEYATGVMKTIASSGNTRGRLYSAKLIMFSVGAMALSITFPIVSTVEVSLLSGFGQLPGGSDLFYLLRILTLTLLYTSAFAAIGALFAVLMTDGGKTIGVSVLFFLGIDVALAGIGSKVAFVETIYQYSIFKLFGDIPLLDVESGEWLALLLVPLATIVVSGFLGNLVFRKKDIK